MSVMKRHYEKVVVCCCFLFLFVNVGFPSTSFNVYQPYIVDVVGDTNGSIVLACRTLASLLSIFFVNRYYLRLDCRLGVLVATMLTAAGFVLYAFACDTPMFCLGAAVSGIGYGLGGMVCMTTLVGRWFRDDVGAAVGVASAGSGMASLVISPLAARVIHATSLSTSFLCEAALAALIGLATFALLRNRPEDMGLAPHTSTRGRAVSPRGMEHAPVPCSIPRGRYVLMLVAMTFMGVISVDGFSYLSILLTTNGVDKLTAATLIAVAGGCLTASKAISGKVFDLVGTFRGSAFFFAVLLVGLALCCLVGLGGVAVAAPAMVAFGFGISLGTVGISVWSLELSTPASRTKTVKDFQIAYSLGGFLFNFVPGTLMDLCGSYVLSYVIMLGFCAACAVITLGTYRRYALRDHMPQ